LRQLATNTVEGRNFIMANRAFLMITAGVAVSFGSGVHAQSSEYPADAQPGQCFARMIIPEVSETVAEQVVDQPERVEMRVIPATYETVTEKVMIREEETLLSVVPGSSRTVTERLLLEPERTETIVVPASMNTVEEKVLVRPAYTTWKTGSGLLGRGGQVTSAGGVVSATRAGMPATVGEVPTGELLCRVEVPAEYRTVRRTVMARPESAQTRVIPARYDTVTKTVVDRPPQVQERKIPAQFRDIQVRRQVTPAREERIVIPASFRTIEKRVVKSPAQVTWREVLCETNAGPEKIRQVQQALGGRGYTTRTDGVFGADTLSAMEQFQRQQGLAVGNLTVETVRSLGLTP
jgi:hypothetical protein